MSDSHTPQTRPYLARLVASTPLRLPDSGIRVHYPDEQIEIWGFRWVAHSPVGVAHLGIEYRVWLDADTAEHALARAEVATERLNAILCLGSSASIPLVRPWLAIDVDRSKVSRELYQRVHNVPTRIPQSRPMDLDVLQGLTDAFNTVSGDPVIRDTVTRALWHYRKGLGTQDLVDEFTELWMGLECLNRLLIKRHNLQTRFLARKCPKCRAPMWVVGSSAGIVHALSKHASATAAQIKEIREVRKQLQHGLTEVTQVLLLLPTLVPFMRRGLVGTLSEVLSVPDHITDKLNRQKYSVSDSPGEMAFATTLHTLSVDDLLAASHTPEIIVGVETVDKQPREQWPTTPIAHPTLQVSIRHYDGEWGPTTMTMLTHDDPELIDRRTASPASEPPGA